MDERTDSLVDECKRQEESCLYTSTALFEWVKFLRVWKIFFVVAPIVLAALATALPVETSRGFGWLAGACTVLAGIATAVYKALDLDVSVEAGESVQGSPGPIPPGMARRRARRSRRIQDGVRHSHGPNGLTAFIKPSAPGTVLQKGSTQDTVWRLHL